MKKNIIILTLLGILTFGCKQGVVTMVSPAEIKELSTLEKAQFVDIRTPEEYAEGYIEGFENIDYLSDSFQWDIEKLDKTKPIILYCRSGGRSGKCAALLLEKGFKEIYDLEGGIIKWKAQGNTLVGN